MIATSCDSKLRDLVATAQDFRDRSAAAELGRILHVPTSTVTRREERHESLLDWRAADFLTLAKSDELLGRAVRQFLAGSSPEMFASVTAITKDLTADIVNSGDLHRVAIESLADGKLERHELVSMRAALLRRQETDAQMLRDIDAGLQVAK